jgi:hypothetical protein
MATSNASEGFFSIITQYSEGKRLNLDQTDLWKNMCELTACNAGPGNKRKTHEEISGLLCIPVSPIESVRYDKMEKTQSKDRIRSLGNKVKRTRTRASLTNAAAMWKEASKSTRYKNSKVPTKESAAVKKQRSCSKCHQIGHTPGSCNMPKLNKRTISYVDWNVNEESVLSRLAKRPRVIIPNVDLLEWF